MKNWLIAGIVAVIAIGALACGGTKALQPEEYAEAVCPALGPSSWDDIDDDATYEEWKDSVDQVIKIIDVDAPEQYARWHAEVIGSFRFFRDWLDDQDSDEILTASALVSEELFARLLLIGSAIEVAAKQFSDEDAQVLIDAGCDIERED